MTGPQTSVHKKMPMESTQLQRRELLVGFPRERTIHEGGPWPTNVHFSLHFHVPLSFLASEAQAPYAAVFTADRFPVSEEVLPTSSKMTLENVSL